MLIKGRSKRYNLKRNLKLWLLENGNFDTMKRALEASPRSVLTRESCRGVALHAIEFSVFITSQLLPARQTVRLEQPQKFCWVEGTLHIKKHILIIHRSSSLDIQWSTTLNHPFHEVKEEYTKQLFLPRKPSCPFQDVYHRHILPSAPRATLFHFFWVFYCSPLFSLSCVYARVTGFQDTPFGLPSYKHSSSFDYPLHFLNLLFYHSYPSPVLMLSSHTTFFQCNQHP